MSAAPAFTPAAWTPSEHMADTHAELRLLGRAVYLPATSGAPSTSTVAASPGPRAFPAPASRLLSDEQAAGYLGVSRSHIRALVARGALRRVDLPAAGDSARRARVLRLDRHDLDRLIETNKEG